MCVNCVSTSEQIAANTGLAFALLRGPVHRMLAAAHLVAPPDPVRRDVRTVGFLRALDLDPAEILGVDAVEQAERWVAPERQVRWRWLRPMGSQSRLAPQ